MPGKIRFGMVGTGFIADWVLAGARQDARFEAVAICSRTQERADAFAAKHGIPHTFTLLEEMAASPLVDAVYIATPNFLHASQSILCMRHGKHVLCEKPLASNAREARQMVAVARECGVTLMEAMISTLNPNFRVVQEYLPRLGTIRRYFASFCQYSSRYDKFRQGIVLNAFNPELSNGAMMDIGVYTVYPMVALFGRPLEVEAQGIVLSSGADGQGAVNFRYEGMNATVLYSKIANSSLPSEIQGEEGNLLLDAIHTIRDVAYLPRPAAASGRGDAPVRHSVGLPLEKDTYYYEVAEFIDLIEQGRIESTVNSHENSLVTMESHAAARTLHWRTSPDTALARFRIATFRSSFCSMSCCRAISGCFASWRRFNRVDPAMASRPEPMPQSIPPRESGTRPSSSRDRTSRTMPMARSPWNRRFFCVRFIQSPSFNTDGGTRR